MLVGTAHFVIPALMNCSLRRTSVKYHAGTSQYTHNAILENTGSQYRSLNISYERLTGQKHPA